MRPSRSRKNRRVKRAGSNSPRPELGSSFHRTLNGISLFHRSTNPAEAASLPGGVLFIRRRPLPRHMSRRSWSGTPQDEPAVEGPWALVVVVILRHPAREGRSSPPVGPPITLLLAGAEPQWMGPPAVGPGPPIAFLGGLCPHRRPPPRGLSRSPKTSRFGGRTPFLGHRLCQRMTVLNLDPRRSDA